MISINNTYKNKLIQGISFALTLLIITGCESNDLPERDYVLEWEDNFDGTTGDLPSSANWNFEIGTGENGWGNGELQYYTDRPENVSLDGLGNLVITAIQESFNGSAYTSARITTKGLQEFTYGRIEARLKTPFSQGLWPAFWMLGADIDTNPWPAAGEIDIMELRGQQPSIVAGSIHGPGYSGGNPVTDEFHLIDGRFDTEFHVFAVEWGPNFIDYFVDGRLYQQITPQSLPEGTEWVFDKDFFLLLNVAVGGGFVGSPSENSRFPQTMVVDYVRVYQ
ncbi:MAG: glycoside hydrolase family 16 protein [Bacteroidota bacterium]